MMNDTISIAPMLDWTDRHYRYFVRLITPHTKLYTEMIVADAIIHGNQNRLLSYDPSEQPLALQLGGSNPEKLYTASKVAMEYGYTEINLNVGCPSPRVQSGSFGACLMLEPNLVTECLNAISQAGATATIKHRIGIDKAEDYEFLDNFVTYIKQHTSVKHFIVHARNAILHGLSPKENREIPPLKYDYVYKLKQLHPELTISINGGINSLTQVQDMLPQLDGVMIGRAAYNNPYLFASIEKTVFANPYIKTRKEIAYLMLNYLQQQQDSYKLHNITKHMIGLYHGQPHAKYWRLGLTQGMLTNDINNYIQLIERLDD